MIVQVVGRYSTILHFQGSSQDFGKEYSSMVVEHEFGTWAWHVGVVCNIFEIKIYTALWSGLGSYLL